MSLKKGKKKKRKRRGSLLRRLPCNAAQGKTKKRGKEPGLNYRWKGKKNATTGETVRCVGKNNYSVWGGRMQGGFNTTLAEMGGTLTIKRKTQGGERKKKKGFPKHSTGEMGARSLHSAKG